MAKRNNGNEKWIEEMAIKRRASASGVIVVVSDDPYREEELKKFVASSAFNQVFNCQPSRKIHVHPWFGGVDLETGEVLSVDVDNPFMASGTRRVPLPVWCEYIDGLVDEEYRAAVKRGEGWSGGVVAVITGIEKPEVFDSVGLAVRSWARDPRFFRTKSTVILMVPEISVIDELSRKFVVEIYPPPSTEAERRGWLEKNGIPYDPQVIDLGKGLTLHEFSTICLESLFLNRKVVPESVTLGKMEIMRKKGYELVYPSYGFEAIGGYRWLKEYIRDEIIFTLKDRVSRKWGLEPIRGIIFFGMEGTGKTLFARAMAKELNMPLIAVGAPSLIEGVVGASARNVERLARTAEANAPVVVFMDEIDALGVSRERTSFTDSGEFLRTQNTLMSWLGDKDRRSIVIGATNLIDIMDPAFIRTGRFDAKIPILPPDFEARKEIFRVHLEVVRRVEYSEDVDFDRLAELTEWWTGADIEAAAKSAARKARKKGLTKVNMECFEEAIEENEPTERISEERVKKMIETAYKYATSKRLVDVQVKALKKKRRKAREDVEKARLEAVRKA